jgi:hypothetical protein
VASDTTATCTLCARPTRDTSNAKVESFHGIEGRIRGGEPPRMAVQLYEHQLSYEPGDFFFSLHNQGGVKSTHNGYIEQSMAWRRVGI